MKRKSLDTVQANAAPAMEPSKMVAPKVSKFGYRAKLEATATEDDKENAAEVKRTRTNQPTQQRATRSSTRTATNTRGNVNVNHLTPSKNMPAQSPAKPNLLTRIMNSPMMSGSASKGSPMTSDTGTPLKSQVMAYVQSVYTVNFEDCNKKFTSKVKNRRDWESKFKESKEVIMELRKTIKQLTEQNKEFIQKCKGLEMKMSRDIHSHKVKTRALTRESDSLKAEVTQVKSEFMLSQQKQQQAEVLADKLAHAKDLIEQKGDEQTSELRELQKSLSSLESKNTDLQTTITRLEEQCKHAQAGREQNAVTISGLKEEHRAETEKLQSEWKTRHEQEMESTSAELASTKGQVSELTGELRALSSGRSQLDTQLTSLRDELKTSQSQKAAVEHKLETALGEVQKMREQVEALNQKLDDKGNELSMALKSFSEMQSSTLGRTNQLMEDKAKLEQKCEEAKSAGDDASRAAERFEREAAEAQSRVVVLESEKMGTDERLASLLAKETKMKAQVLEAEGKLAVELHMRERLEMREAEQRKEHTAVCAQLLAVQAASEKEKGEYRKGLDEQQAKWVAEKEAMGKEMTLSEERCCELREAKVTLESEMRTLKDSIEKHQGHAEQLEKLCHISGEADVLRTRLAALEKQRAGEVKDAAERVAELEQQVQKGEITRRKMHNQIQELRGNVRVFVRARPFLPSDGVADDVKDMATIDPKADGSSLQLLTYGGDEKKVRRKGEDLSKVTKKESFTFDKVFAPVTGQQEVFEEVSEFVQSALDGYNVCLFSYGQTGSGKTHTMQGSGTGQMRGIIPRSMEKVFLYAQHLSGQGWKYSMEVSFLEIYNEDIKDLLRSSKTSSDEKHQIKRDASGEMIVSGLTRVSVEIGDADKVEKLMELASRQRSVGRTDMNAQSSRSHSVFILYLKAENSEQQTTLRGTLNLVDLAGSERLSRSGASGDRLKETQAINKSLSCLTDVFVAIGNKNGHVPYRNSKLTYLLQPALSGDGKTLMMVNVSPTPASYFETLCSLRFARQVNQCELGKPKRQLNSMDKKSKREAEEGSSRSSKLRKIAR